MANFTTVVNTHTITQNVEFSVAQNANFNAASLVATTGKVQSWIDLLALVAGDIVEIRFYRAINGGTATAVDVSTIQTPQIFSWPLTLVTSGWDITVKLTTATSRSINYDTIQDTNDVNVASITAGAIAAASFAAGAITSTVLAANAITSSIIAASAIGASQIASAAITAAKFATDAIDGPAVAASAVTKIQTGLALAATALSNVQWTNARAAFLDNLNVGGNVSSSAEVVAIQNNTRVVRVVPNVIERPDTGTTTYRVELLLYDSVGNMEVPDSAPTVALVNQAGTSLTARLDSTTMALISTGRYRVIYTADAADALEQLVWTFTVIEGGATRLYGNGSIIVDTSAVDFTSSDRTLLTTLATDYTTARAAKIDNLDGTVTSRASATALAAVQDDTDDIQTRLPAALVGGKMSSDATVVLGAGSITSSTFAAGAITAAAIASGALTAIADAIFAFVVEVGAPSTAQTFLQQLRVKWSVFAGKASGLAISTAGSEVFRDAADTKPRATFTLATDGSRTPGTLDGD